MTIPRVRVLAYVLLPLQLVLGTGCVDWFRMQTTTPPEPAPRSMQVWTGDSAVVVRYPIERNDSLIATIGGDSARQGGVPVSWALVDVDSTRLRRVSASRSILAAVGIFIVVLIACYGCVALGS